MIKRIDMRKRGGPSLDAEYRVWLRKLRSKDVFVAGGSLRQEVPRRKT